MLKSGHNIYFTRIYLTILNRKRHTRDSPADQGSCSRSWWDGGESVAEKKLYKEAIEA